MLVLRNNELLLANQLTQMWLFPHCLILLEILSDLCEWIDTDELGMGWGWAGGGLGVGFIVEFLFNFSI